MSEQPGGMFFDGLYVPPIGFYGFPKLGEWVWGSRVEDKIKFLRSLREGSEEHAAVRETLYYRWKRANHLKRHLDAGELICNCRKD